MQRVGDGLPERAKDTEADHRVRVLTSGESIVGHFPDNRGDHGPDSPDRLERVAAARLHELPPGVAGHDLLDIAAQRTKRQPVFPDEAGEVLGRSQTHLISRLLQPSPQCDAGLDITA